MAEQETRYSQTSSLPFLVPVQKAPTITNIVLRSAAVATGVFGVCILAQWLIYGKILGQDSIRYTTPAIAAIVTGLATFRMLMMDRLQILAYIQRFQAIGEAHHHIRNALQSLSYQRYLTEDESAANRLLDAVNRIQWVLDEVFPRLETRKLRRADTEHPSGSHRRTNQAR